MKKYFTIALPPLALVLFLTGCWLFTGGPKPVVVEPAKADAALYQQIAVPFSVYYKAEADTLPPHAVTSYDAAVETWATTGSNWEVYDTIAPPYVVYLHKDPTLSPDSVDIRTDTVLAWKIFLENTVGPAEGDVFDAKAPVVNP